MSWQDRFESRDDFHKEVRRLVLEVGLTYSKAAEAIGFSTTKNQVVRAMQTILGRTRSTVTFPDSVWPSEPKSKDEKAGEAAEAPIHITAVRDGQCRAPLWPDFLHSTQRVDPSEHMLCGKNCKDGSSWCEDHHALFFPPDLQKRPTKKRRDEVKDNSAQFQ